MNILAVTTMRNEGPHCLEWIAHHLAIGVDHFLIYTNDCDDGTDSILKALVATGMVTHIPHSRTGKQPIQWQALKDAWSHPQMAKADWVMITDCDEFVNLRAKGATLKTLIADLPDQTDAITLPWRLFGHSGRMHLLDQPTTEQFTLAAPPDVSLPIGHFFKSLFRPKSFRQIGVHRPKHKKNQTPNWVDGSGKAMSEKFSTMDHRINLYGMPAQTDLLQLNHYSLRSAESFVVKCGRGLPNHINKAIGLGYWVERNFNSVEDKTINKMLSATHKMLAELKQVKTVADLHEQAFAAHKKMFETAMQQREMIQLFWQLALSATSYDPPKELAHAQIRRINLALKSDRENEQ